MTRDSLLFLPHAIVPSPGASRPETIADSAAAVELTLDDGELARLNAELLG